MQLGEDTPVRSRPQRVLPHRTASDSLSESLKIYRSERKVRNATGGVIREITSPILCLYGNNLENKKKDQQQQQNKRRDDTNRLSLSSPAPTCFTVEAFYY